MALNTPLIGEYPTDDYRLDRFTRQVRLVLNSLIRSGALVIDEDGGYSIDPDVVGGGGSSNSSSALNGITIASLKGEPGNRWFTGQGPPSPDQGRETDLYFQANGSFIWEKSSPFFGAPARWKVFAKLPSSGPRGPAGRDGSNGRDGKDGANGATGATGAAGAGSISVLSNQTFSGVPVATVTGIAPAAGETFFVVLSVVTVSVDDDELILQVSDDNGVTYESTTYFRAVRSRSSNGNSDDDNSGADSGVRLVSDNANFGIGNAANESYSGSIELGELGATGYKHVTFAGGHTGPTGGFVTTVGSGSWQGGTGAINAIQLTCGAGNIAGRMTVYKRAAS
jgi:hypothetical protein